MTGAVDAVVLAGGINEVPLFAGYAPGPKAMLTVGGRPLLDYTLQALRGIPQIRRVCIVGPSTLAPSGGYEFAAEGDTLLESVSNGLRRLGGTSPVLVATADTPLLTQRAVGEFLHACADVRTLYSDSVFLAVVPAHCFGGMFEGVEKRFTRFRDITVCHGNLALLAPGAVAKASSPGRLNALYAARKHPVRAALVLGWRVGLSYLLGVHFCPVLTMVQMSRIASRRFGIGLVPVPLEHPEVAIDVDEAADYRFVEAQLAR